MLHASGRSLHTDASCTHAPHPTTCRCGRTRRLLRLRRHREEGGVGAGAGSARERRVFTVHRATPAPTHPQGIQVRKLYRPEQFPNAPVLPIFEKHFGPAPRSSVCAVGFEPNPAHTPYLSSLNAWFRGRGFPAVILTETAVGREAGDFPFYINGHDEPGLHDRATSMTRSVMMQGLNAKVINVAVADFTAFMTKVVRPILDLEERRTGRRPPVVMKVDIEVRQQGLGGGSRTPVRMQPSARARGMQVSRQA